MIRRNFRKDGREPGNKRCMIFHKRWRSGQNSRSDRDELNSRSKKKSETFKLFKPSLSDNVPGRLVLLLILPLELQPPMVPHWPAASRTIFSKMGSSSRAIASSLVLP